MNKKVLPFQKPDDWAVRVLERADFFFANENEDIGIVIRSYEENDNMIASLHLIEQTARVTYRLSVHIDTLIFPDKKQRQHFIDTFAELSIVDYYSKWAFGEMPKL
ncbi:hypothetical protein [Ectobacillus sp. sgz5001026]|uniref:hypothetical protein n=1 Tax=Ectobacillus sp. sgz5001026 TaxID=3242473 RepID=UPI0036D3E07B